jgi:hypothetical protein
MKPLGSILLSLLWFNTLAMGQTQAVEYNGNPLLKSEPNDGLLSYAFENFEAARFPPAGWAVEFIGSQLWSRWVGASGYGVGVASANFDFFVASTGTTQSLVLSTMGASAPGDQLRFDHAYATYTTENDQLIIETSTDGGASYATLVTLNGGVSGPLVTAPPHSLPFLPTASEWATKTYPLPAGTNRVRFKAVSAYGNNLYVDNCAIGTQRAIDVGTQSIDILNGTFSQIPKVTVKNHGTAPQTFTVTLLISPEGYTSVRTVTALAGNATSQVSFDGWTAEIGIHHATAFATLVGDADPSNDTLESTIEVQPATGMSAFFRDGQVFVTWENLSITDVLYTLYKSSTPILSGMDLPQAQNLGKVPGNSALNRRLTDLSLGLPKYLKIDSASAPLAGTSGLFVATSTATGSFYYAVTATFHGSEDTAIVVGSNALAAPVSESVMMPRPVWQESRIAYGRTYEIYVQFTSKVTSSIYPQMTNVGSYPFHFAIVKSGSVSPHPVTYWMHGSSGSLLPGDDYRVVGDPNEWVITIDDGLPPNSDGFSLYFGFHEDYDIFSNANPIPPSGTIYDYTLQRILFTIDWTLRNLPLDTTRTYLTGKSSGAIGSIFTAMKIPERIAAIFVYVPLIDVARPPSTNFNLPGIVNRFYGTYQTNLLTNDGYRRNERLNANFLARENRMKSLPIMFTFCGRNDGTVGWAEKIPFYDTLKTYRHGGFHFWGTGNHAQTFFSSQWQPSFPNFSFFTRYRTNLSYPAFSNCSINNNPGNGTPSSGDLIGTINGHLDWTDDIVDTTDRWEVTLRIKDLATTSGARIAPDSATTDVTLRRLQAFSVPSGYTVNWENRRGTFVVQQGSFAHDSGLVTIPAVKVYRDSSRLTVTYTLASVAEEEPLPREFTLLQNYPNPFNPTTEIQFTIVNRQSTIVKVYDVLGRDIATLVNEVKEPGTYTVQWDASGQASGVYFCRLQTSSLVDMKKLLLLK